MAKKDPRHHLLIYTYMLNRWWRATLAISLTIFILLGGLYALPRLLPQYTFIWLGYWEMWLLAGAGGLGLVITILLVSLRNSAYVRPYKKHILLATPFLHLNISYKRMVKTYSAEFQNLFPIIKAHGLRRTRLEPLASKTVFVIELTSFPLPRWVLRTFLSPLFFPDRTARLALLVPDWMALSAEVDGFLGSYQETLRPVAPQSAAHNLLVGLKNPPK